MSHIGQISRNWFQTKIFVRAVQIDPQILSTMHTARKRSSLNDSSGYNTVEGAKPGNRLRLVIIKVCVMLNAFRMKHNKLQNTIHVALVTLCAQLIVHGKYNLRSIISSIVSHSAKQQLVNVSADRFFLAFSANFFLKVADIQASTFNEILNKNFSNLFARWKKSSLHVFIR